MAIQTMFKLVGTGIVLGLSTCVAFTLHVKNASLQRQIMSMKKQRSTRTYSKNKKDANGNNEPSNDNKITAPAPSISYSSPKESESETDYTMKEIGRITSPYPQRAGTPRQGLIAKHSRSILTLHDGIAKACLEDLPQYSHVWVIFQFHLNPIGKGKDKKAPRTREQQKGNQKQKGNQNQNQSNSPFLFSASKIKPPRANGQKVSVFATRSPHRPNNVGLSLAMVEEVTTLNIVERQGQGGKQKIRKKTVLKLLGLDLVDGTPVYDLKPMCPSDIVPLEDLRVPSWVSADDQLSAVEWTEEAKDSIREYQKSGLLEPLYPAKNVGEDEDEVMQAISEIVGQDPRAQHEGRGNATEASSTYEITFSTLRVKFQVVGSSLSATDENHRAKIVEIVRDEGDETAQPGSYQHSLGMRRRAEKEAQARGLTLYWKHSVREGITTGIFDLRDGTQYSFE